jgi:hypothetical protein
MAPPARDACVRCPPACLSAAQLREEVSFKDQLLAAMDSEMAAQSERIGRLAEDVRLAQEASGALEALANQRNEAVQLLVGGPRVAGPSHALARCLERLLRGLARQGLATAAGRRRCGA